MAAVRFLEAELDYGCHAGVTFSFPDAPEPAVVAGPNGAGKSTLLEALARALFGFRRRTDEEKTVLEARRPWTADRCRARVVIAAADGARWVVERDFTTARVVLQPVHDADSSAGAAPAVPGTPWSGDGNPGADNPEAREYRRRLATLIGLSDPDAYRATACIHQGELTDTRLDEALLRVAAGGHGNVDAAKKAVADAHRELTLRPIEPAVRRATKARALEAVEAEIEQARIELKRALDADERRGPLLEAQAETAARMKELVAEIAALEAAHQPLVERRAIEAERETWSERVNSLTRARRRLDEALRQAAAQGAVPGGSGGSAGSATSGGSGADRATPAATVPLDPAALTAARDAIAGVDAAADPLAEIDERMKSRPRLETDRAAAAAALAAAPPRRWAVPAAIALAGTGLAAAAILAASGRFLAGGAAALVSLAIAAGLGLMHRRTRSERDRRRLAADQAARRLADFDHGLARQLGAVLDDALENARRALATKELALEQAGAAGLVLPDGVPPEPQAVARALAERRRERDDAAQRLRELERNLLEATTGAESPVAIRDRLDALEARRAELDTAAAAHEAAYALLRDAYDEFRARDQERLLDRVSARLRALAGRALGPVEAPGSLAGATVGVRGRAVPLVSPPLSFGEWHATLLAVRLGAADFLATAGAALPLVVDEPFAFLDPDRARALWGLLRAVARERQVIVATQDRLTLEWLGATPAIELTAAPAGG